MYKCTSESRKFSWHPCIGCIARSYLRQHSFLVFTFQAQHANESLVDRGSAPYPAGGACDARQTPSLLGEGDIPSHSPPPRRLPTSGASVLRPPQHKILATPVTDNDIDERLYVQVGPKNVDTLHVREYPTMHFPE